MAEWTFAHTHNQDGYFEARCPVCGFWVASCPTESALKPVEKAHECDLNDLAYPILWH